MYIKRALVTNRPFYLNEAFALGPQKAHVNAHIFAILWHQRFLKSTIKGTLKAFYYQNNFQKETALNCGSCIFVPFLQEGKAE